MPTVGKHGLDMMSRTCTIQVNLDYSDEVDMVKKFQTSLALQPISTALFANSPFIEGEKGSGEVTLNGPAARKVQKGDLVIIISYAQMELEKAKFFKPTIIFPSESSNRLI